MKWLCSLIGHRALTLQTPEICSHTGGGEKGHWYWPGVITYCPRCGYVFTAADGSPTAAPPWANK